VVLETSAGRWSAGGIGRTRRGLDARFWYPPVAEFTGDCGPPDPLSGPSLWGTRMRAPPKAKKVLPERHGTKTFMPDDRAFQ